MNIPSNLLYTKDHEWIQINGDIATVGITDFAQSELGDIVFIEVDTVGETLAKETVFGTVEAVKTVSDLFMPVSGKILEFNATIVSTPALVNTNPYEEGWLIKLKMSDLSESPGLLTEPQYRELIGKKIT